MTNAERATASVSNGALVWNGAAVNAQLSRMTAGLSTPGGHLRLYAPTTWSDGSSVSHWDTVATPDLLMEPFLRPNPQGLTDLTGCVVARNGHAVATGRSRRNGAADVVHEVAPNVGVCRGWGNGELHGCRRRRTLAGCLARNHVVCATQPFGTLCISCMGLGCPCTQSDLDADFSGQMK